MTKTPLVNQPGSAPTRKVTAIAVTGAVLTTGVWVVEQFYGLTIPSEVQGSLHTAAGLLVGYVVHDRMNA